MHQARGYQRPLLAGVEAYGLAVFQKKERGQRAPRLRPPGGHQLRRFEDMDRRIVAVLGLAFIDVGQSGIGSSEVDADFHMYKSLQNSESEREPRSAPRT